MNAKLSVQLRCERRSDQVSLLALGLLASIFLAALVWKQGIATPSARSPVNPLFRRAYYLTTVTVPGDQALTACAAGYHMTSLWEITDTSNLYYDSTLGYSLNADQGGGPPTWDGVNPIAGWVRTGGASSTVITLGVGNCNAWTNGDLYHYGTMVSLDHDWTTIDNWQAASVECATSHRVWCVADHAGKRIYLPVVKKAP